MSRPAGATAPARSRRISAAARDAWIGLGVGLGFVILGTGIAMAFAGRPFSPVAALAAQAGDPVLWVVDTAPVVLALCGALTGRQRDRADRLAARLADECAGTHGRLSTTMDALIDTRQRQRSVTDRLRRLEEIWHAARATLPDVLCGDARHVENGIVHGLRLLGRTARAGRAYLFRVDLDREVMHNTHEWCEDGISAHIDDLQDVPLSTFPWILGILRRGEVVDVSTVSVIPTVSNERESIEAQGIRAMLVAPVCVDGRLVGFAGFDDTARERPWDPELAGALHVFAAAALSAGARGRAAVSTA